jgi:hypothetical protein
VVLHQNSHTQAGRRAADRSIVHLDARALDALVGVYDLTPDFAITISREVDYLKAQASGQHAFEIFPQGPTAFFFKVADAQLTFELGPDCRAVSLVLHQNGHSTPGRRRP